MANRNGVEVQYLESGRQRKSPVPVGFFFFFRAECRSVFSLSSDNNNTIIIVKIIVHAVTVRAHRYRRLGNTGPVVRSVYPCGIRETSPLGLVRENRLNLPSRSVRLPQRARARPPARPKTNRSSTALPLTTAPRTLRFVRNLPGSCTAYCHFCRARSPLFFVCYLGVSKPDNKLPGL